jgi:N-carbamoyl-L-amino-acid hydrolase
MAAVRGDGTGRESPLAARFDAAWRELAPIGRDALTGAYHRSAWTSVDGQLRAWFRAQAGARDMPVSADRNGNQWAWWGRPGPDAVVTGSHLDSVPGGGAYDGPLGVVSAFLAVDDLRAREVTPSRPIALVHFADEEGARFGVSCVGSRLMTGVLDPDRAGSLRDAEGITLAEAMHAAGSAPERIGRDADALARIGAFVELHIEQGRALADVPAPLAVASGIWPHGRWRLAFTGSADHAGTTRLADRDDPMLTLATVVQQARASAERHGSLATIGKLRVRPNGVNAIPSEVTAWLDARGPVEADVRSVVAEVGAAAGIDAVEESWTGSTRFDADLRDQLAAVLADAAGTPAPMLPTGAGHDAGILAAAGVRTAMLFVRNPTGVSHSPAEHAEPADCLAGVAALARAVEALA